MGEQGPDKARGDQKKEAVQKNLLVSAKMPLEIEKAEPNDDMQGEGDGAKNRGKTDVRKGDIVTKEKVFNMSLF